MNTTSERESTGNPNIRKHSRFQACILDEFLVRIWCYKDANHIAMVTHGEYDRRVREEVGCEQCREVAVKEV